MKKSALLTLSLAALVAPAMVLGADAPSDDKAKAVFEDKCNLCHKIDRPLGKNKDHAGWLETVTRMQGKAAGKISNDDVKTIVEYLDKIRGPK